MRLNEISECAICQVEFEAPCVLSVLGCNQHHMFHVECLDGWVKHNQDKGSIATCPMCRKEIITEIITKMDYKGLTKLENEEIEMKDTHPDDEAHDMFGVDRPTE